MKIFEKSATYFCSSQAVGRMKTLLPNIQLVAVLLEPGERAYSWYQHQKAHRIEAAQKYTFNQILNMKEDQNDFTTKAALDLRQVKLYQT